MILLGVFGLVATLGIILLLAVVGFRLAFLLLPADEHDPLTLAVAGGASVLAMAVLIAMGLGAIGLLRPAYATLLLLGTLGLLGLTRRARLDELRLALMETVRAAGGGVREQPLLWLLVGHLACTELLRGLLLPPLAWDSLMYHLLLAGTWLQRGDITPVFGGSPISFYGFQPGNGSLWFWWWMAPSHSELFVALSGVLPWGLFGLAAGRLARQLGATRTWPIAAAVLLATPVVSRLLATQYVDLFAASTWLAGLSLGLSWLDRPRRGTAILAALAVGAALGAKVLFVPYVGFLLLTLLGAALAKGGWGRIRQMGWAAVAIAATGAGFYLRNQRAGVGPFGGACETTDLAAGASAAFVFPRMHSLARAFADGREPPVLDAFLGTTARYATELGVGPQFAVLALALLGLALCPRERRGLVALVAAQVPLHLVFCATVPVAHGVHVLGEIRYLLPVLGIAAAALAVLLERVPSTRAAGLFAAVLVLQSLSLSAPEWTRGTRLAIGIADLAILAFVLRPGAWMPSAAQRKIATVVAVGTTLLATSWLVDHRLRDRGRAFAQERQLHDSWAPNLAGAWDWLDRFGGSDTVAVSLAPKNEFVYPAMGPFFERRAIFVSAEPGNPTDAVLFPACEPEHGGTQADWLENMQASDARWLLVGRRFEGWPREREWARQHLDALGLRYADDHAEIYELLPAGGGETASGPPAGGAQGRGAEP
jgi:hypothetical protein